MVLQAWRVPNPSVSMFDEVPSNSNESPHPRLGDPPRVWAPETAVPDQSLELEANKHPGNTPASGSKYPMKFPGSSEMGVDTIPLHAERVRSTVATHLEIGNNLQVRPGTGSIKPAIPTGPSTGKIRPAIPTGPSTGKIRPAIPTRPSTGSIRPAIPIGPKLCNKAWSHPCWNSGLSPPKRRQTPETPSKPPHVPKHSESSSAKAISHLSEPRSIAPVTSITLPNDRSIRHLKSHSVDAPEFHQSPPSNLPSTPLSSHENNYGRSVTIGSGQSNPGYPSIMQRTPLRQGNAWHSRQTSMRTPPIPVASGVLEFPGVLSEPSMGYRYPEPHQHTPEGQGQYFNPQVSMPPLMQARFSNPLSSHVPPFPFSMRTSDNNTMHQNAQVYKQGEQNAEYPQSNHFDSYTTSQAPNAASNAADLHQNGNMYTQDTNGYGPRYYSNHTDPAHQVSFCPLRIDSAGLIKPQLNQNLYSPLEPHRERSKPNQRTAKDLFIPEDIRLKLHTKTEATLRVFAGRPLPYKNIQLWLWGNCLFGLFSNEHTCR